MIQWESSRILKTLKSQVESGNVELWEKTFNRADFVGKNFHQELNNYIDHKRMEGYKTYIIEDDPLTSQTVNLIIYRDIDKSLDDNLSR